MHLARILTLLVVGMSFLELPAGAKDKDKDKKKHKDKDRDEHHDHSDDYYYRQQRPSVTIAVQPQRRTYYTRPSSTVVIQQQRPAYYDQQRYVDQSSYSSPSLGIDVQRGLARQGYYRGPIDGDIGPGSRSAIRAFQADNGLAPTGRIDRRLLEALR